MVKDLLPPVALSLLPYFLALIAPLAFLGLPRFSRRCASVIDCVSGYRGRISRRREEFAKSRAERRTTAVFSFAKPFLGMNTT